jgi:roadblock/LC7 domain-containing protein
MSILSELVAMPGVMAAGEYSYRGDRFTYKGHLDEEQARMASVMCRATTMSVHMQAGILESFCNDCGAIPARGWVVRGPRFAVCVIANVFCFLDSENASVNEVVKLMRERLADAPADLV